MRLSRPRVVVIALRPVALDAMLPFLRDHHADPGRVHQEGHITRAAIEEAREHVAALFGARPREVVFTSSGTESVNTAVFGALGRRASDGAGHVVTTAVEHSAVLESATASEVTEVGVDSLGHYGAARCSARARQHRARHRAARQPRGRHRAAGRRRGRRRERGITVHVGALTAAGFPARRLRRAGRSISCRSSAAWFERPRRGGTARASPSCGSRRSSWAAHRSGSATRRHRERPRDRRLRRGGRQVDVSAEAARARHSAERLAAGACAVDGVARLGDPVDALPHLVCLGVEGVEAEPILLGLDRRGVAVHSGSSCSSESASNRRPCSRRWAWRPTGRCASVGWSSTDDDVDVFLAAFPEVVAALRGLRAG
ncbi:MAG: aminotransferase class V-fold PLP-dependent enzyme [Acidimicrobiia bacterium]